MTSFSPADIVARARGEVGDDFRSPQLAGPEIDPLPRAADLPPGTPAEEVAAWLARYGILPDPSQLRADAEAYVARLTTLEGEAYWLEVERVIARDGLVPLARRVEERYLRALAPSAEYVRMGEGDSSSCAACDALAGEIGSLQHHAQLGMPGSQSCLGGDRCRCLLLPIE